MSGATTRAVILHSDTEAGRFIVLLTENGDLACSHWRTFQQAGFPSVTVGQAFEVRLGMDPRDGATPRVHEVLGEVELAEAERNWYGVTVRGMSDANRQPLSSAKMAAELTELPGIKVFANQELDCCEFSDMLLDGSVVLANCRIRSDFRWLNTRVKGGLWFLNCIFEGHFSIKGSHLDHSAILFGCDFGGAGGISFRGLRACSLLVEYGTRGSKDMLWLNEMSLSGCLALNGTFEAPVQILARQDDVPVNQEPGLGAVYIGRQSYKAERLSNNCFPALSIDGYDVEGAIEIHHAKTDSLTLSSLRMGQLTMVSCEIGRDLWLDRLEVCDLDQGISVHDTYIGRYFRISGESLQGRLSLAGSSVGQAWQVELSQPEKGTPSLEMERFHAQQAWFDPIRLIYGQTPLRRFITPPPFGLLARAHLRSPSAEDSRHLAEAYTRFKNWLAESGYLREEDHAFFYMRHYKETKRTQRMLLGGVFGWGIRLRNIIASAFMLICLFATLYSIVQLDLPESAMLSIQAFIGIFFGHWPEYPVIGSLSFLVTLQSMTGVLFVTVLVGAYIRKLLR
ncbi:hypothetical protein [Billgrantia kenyensis]|uniref:Uncharacterized protein n=1 Tax=Billgrantia kenyensis TaxID=321266 RepID=A0A7V9W0C8_9GAMM|nr:hypothetical protein [Halomonas kenyensis]MBA2778743.1 hypothetical protein [Halomonas kenyensis]MCG6661805.1 hypothetical protein [Halomonas kenyensis]